MKRLMLIFGSVVTISALFFSSGKIYAADVDGKSAFDSYCSGCHPEGRNPQNPSKSLLKMNREANGIRGTADIVRLMRKPGTGMRQFTKEDIPDKTAKAIAEYIINTF
jgi:mono/diheme cytochrome c family protein